jgi:hydroxypyruvate isomerase
MPNSRSDARSVNFQPDRRQLITAAGATIAAAALGMGQSSVSAEQSAVSSVEKPGRTPNTPFAVNVEMWFKSKKTFLEKIEAAAELGFPAIEFWPYENRPIKEAADLLRSKGMAVSQFTAWPFGTILNNPNSDHEDFYRKIQESCDIADQLDCSLFTVVVGNDIPGVSKADMHAAAIRGLKKVKAVCEQRKKTIIIEPMNPRNHPKHCLYGGDDAIAICKAVDSPSVRINWDLYHMQIVDGDLCMRMREGFEYIGYLQLADNPGRNEPGTGELNYTRVFREIKQLGYKGYVGLECNPLTDDLTAAQRVYLADTWS